MTYPDIPGFKKWYRIFRAGTIYDLDFSDDPNDTKQILCGFPTYNMIDIVSERELAETIKSLAENENSADHTMLDIFVMVQYVPEHYTKRIWPKAKR